MFHTDVAIIKFLQDLAKYLPLDIWALLKLFMIGIMSNYTQKFIHAKIYHVLKGNLTAT